MQTVMVGCVHTSPEAQSSLRSQPLGSGVMHDDVSTHTPPPQSSVHTHSPFAQSHRDGMQRPLASWHVWFSGQRRVGQPPGAGSSHPDAPAAPPPPDMPDPPAPIPASPAWPPVDVPPVADVPPVDVPPVVGDVPPAPPVLEPPLLAPLVLPELPPEPPAVVPPESSPASPDESSLFLERPEQAVAKTKRTITTARTTTPF
jgi:hypothetical protein